MIVLFRGFFTLNGSLGVGRSVGVLQDGLHGT